MPERFDAKPEAGFWGEIRSLPPLHRALVSVAMVWFLWLVIEATLFIPYVVSRWGWGYSL